MESEKNIGKEKSEIFAKISKKIHRVGLALTGRSEEETP
jgi:hypothetical protein